MAVVLSKALFGDEAAPLRDFLTPDEIKLAIRESKNYRHDLSEPSQSKVLLFFDTRLQRTWLTKTLSRLYCILDDLGKPAPNINWSMPMEEVVNKNKLIMPVKAHGLSETGKSGLIDFGSKHRDWIYSTRLFTVRPVQEEIEAFLTS